MRLFHIRLNRSSRNPIPQVGSDPWVWKSAVCINFFHKENNDEQEETLATGRRRAAILGGRSFLIESLPTGVSWRKGFSAVQKRQATS